MFFDLMQVDKEALLSNFMDLEKEQEVEGTLGKKLKEGEKDLKEMRKERERLKDLIERLAEEVEEQAQSHTGLSPAKDSRDPVMQKWEELIERVGETDKEICRAIQRTKELGNKAEDSKQVSAELQARF